MFRKLVLSISLLLASAASQAATEYVGANGSTGVQLFSFTFDQDYSGLVAIGVSDEGDYFGNSYLNLVFSKTLAFALDTIPHSDDQSNYKTDTSGFFNTQNEYGVEGEVLYFNIDKKAGDTLKFKWAFSTDEPGPLLEYNDFAFIYIPGMTYQVLAEVNAIPVPAAAWLFGSALLGLVGVRRKRAAVAA
ncbi:hypothetical protein E4634_09905 [Mangrovimicrobium sediminis]|uniref:VPLPA-CTERM sorting domain-containing protein n=1 Tax=Mangrovimicrobium sediminis TaxID=2562682 RepID=A0A4Z0M1D5_9GAMM|nr:VPLPA-CTERM sorting domain-containing protein [Haliea sp. SAOS-164]TGD73339.1 hypothetical protein E4634_09905 [Haliea sp. SAOS-164]